MASFRHIVVRGDRLLICGISLVLALSIVCNVNLFAQNSTKDKHIDRLQKELDDQQADIDKLGNLYQVPPEQAKHIVRTVYRETRGTEFEPSLVLGMMAVESFFDQFAVSNKCAIGLLQIHCIWVPKLQLKSWRDLFDTRTNVRVALDIMAEYKRDYGPYWLLAYNRGPGNVLADLLHRKNPDNGYPAAVRHEKCRISVCT